MKLRNGEGNVNIFGFDPSLLNLVKYLTLPAEKGRDNEQDDGADGKDGHQRWVHPSEAISEVAQRRHLKMAALSALPSVRA